MTARRIVRSARAAGDEAAETQAHAAVAHAKRALGERGPVWWTDGAPDLNRHMARTTPYAAWFAELAVAGNAGGSAAGSCEAPEPDGHRRRGAVLSD
jgi:hypothetical protein